MAERLRVAALNAENGFASHYSSMEGVLNDDREHPNDVLIISEAAPAVDDGKDALYDARRFLSTKGYKTLDVPYDDEDDRPDKHRLLVAVQRERLVGLEPIRLADNTGVGRTAVRASLIGDIDVIAGHLDDRSEKTRRLQVRDMLGAVAVERTTVFAGDMNAMHRWNTVATFARGTKLVLGLPSRLLPVGTPGTEQSLLARANSLYRRVTEMADGGTLREMEAKGYRDADTCHFPTKGFTQLDHIMVPDNVCVTDFDRRDTYGLSDHLGIVAVLDVYPKAS